MMRPESLTSWRVSSLMVVVLPAPEGPRKPKHSPRSTSKERWQSTRFALKLKDTSSMDSRGFMGDCSFRFGR